MKETSPEEVLRAAKDEEEAKRKHHRRQEKTLFEKRGFSFEGQEYDAYS